jgi:hypothetical protein
MGLDLIHDLANCIFKAIVLVQVCLSSYIICNPNQILGEKICSNSQNN